MNPAQQLPVVIQMISDPLLPLVSGYLLLFMPFYIFCRLVQYNNGVQLCIRMLCILVSVEEALPLEACCKSRSKRLKCFHNFYAVVGIMLQMLVTISVIINDNANMS